MQSQISSKNSIIYENRTIKRAERALSCSPFQLNLFKAMQDNSVPLPEMAGNQGVKEGYTRKSLPEAQVESQLLWLIKVGLLRREVDGQGITDSFRLTPLGRQLVSKFESQGDRIPSATIWTRIINTLSRWVRVFS